MALLSLFFMGNSEGTSHKKRHYVPEMRTRTKMKECRKRPRSARECAKAHSFL